MEWENASTGETWDGKDLAKIYNEARMNLSVEAAAAGKLEVRVAGHTDPVATYEFSYAGQKLERTFIVDGDVELLWNAGGDVTTEGNFIYDISNRDVFQNVTAYLAADGKVNIRFNTPAYISGGNFDWAVKVGNYTVESGNDASFDADGTTDVAMTGTIAIKESDTVTVVLSDVNITGVKRQTGALANNNYIKDFQLNDLTTSITTGSAGTSVSAWFEPIDFDGAEANNGKTVTITYSIEGGKTVGGDTTGTAASSAITSDGRTSIQLPNIVADGDSAVTVNITNVSVSA